MSRPQLRFTHYDLKAQPAGAIVEVALSCINNVRLMDAYNYGLFKALKPHKFLGGLTKVSPARLVIPAGGHWHLVVDMDGLPELANSSIKTYLPSKFASGRKVPDSKAGNRSNQAGGIARPVTTIRESDLPEEDISADYQSANLNSVEAIRRELDNYKRIANTDALTGLNNRRAFDLKLDSVFKAADHLESAALIIGDIDHFKKFNDTYGHPVGDLVLQSVARVFSASLRGGTFVARTGGEEFAFIIEGVGRNLALQVAERVCRAVELAVITDPRDSKTYGPVTISLGLCMASEASGPETLYQKADCALYASKRNGRNQCNAFHESMEHPAVQSAAG